MILERFEDKGKKMIPLFLRECRKQVTVWAVVTTHVPFDQFMSEYRFIVKLCCVSENYAMTAVLRGILYL